MRVQQKKHSACGEDLQDSSGVLCYASLESRLFKCRICFCSCGLAPLKIWSIHQCAHEISLPIFLITNVWPGILHPIAILLILNILSLAVLEDIFVHTCEALPCFCFMYHKQITSLLARNLATDFIQLLLISFIYFTFQTEAEMRKKLLTLCSQKCQTFRNKRSIPILNNAELVNFFMEYYIFFPLWKGSGGYADNCSGATSTTGHGESIMKVVLARLILYHMEQGKFQTSCKLK